MFTYARVKCVQGVEEVTGRILEESVVDNALACPSTDWEEVRSASSGVPQAEHMTSKYGSFSAATLLSRTSRVDAKTSPLIPSFDTQVRLCFSVATWYFLI